MRIFGADLPRGGSGGENTLVSTDDSGSIVSARHLAGLPSVAEAIRQRAAGEPFLVAVNLPVVVPSRAARGRPVENLVRRRFGVRLRPGGRAALSAEATGVASEALLAGLAAAGHPCLPYPDRDGRASGLAEIHPELVLKALLWEVSGMSHAGSGQRRAELFRAYAAPAYRARDESKRSSWADRAVALDLAQRALGSPRFYDLRPAREALDAASSPRDVERAGALLDAALVAGTARRYVESPEECLFFGDRETGYVILPADAFVRRLALHDVRPQRGQLFPKTSLQERLGDDAELRPLELLTVEGRPQQIEAEFRKRPVYEFDNVDEMLWWKHCRHLSGPALPTEGLKELVVLIGGGEAAAGPGRGLRLVRSRHRTLSFRFDPTGEWRSHLPTRDGRTYALHVLRAVYDTAASEAP